MPNSRIINSEGLDRKSDKEGGSNKARKILLVSNGFYPEISPRSYRVTELAKELFRQGHEVTVISKFRDHDYNGFLDEYPINLKMWGSSKWPKIPDLKNKYWSFLCRGFSRVLSILFEYPAIEDMFKVKKELKPESGYDLLISFAVPYPVHWGVAWARTATHRIAAKWVADCGDPYMGDVLDSFRKPFYFGLLEKWFCRKADYLSIPLDSARSGYYKEFQNKIKVIPQGFDFDSNNNMLKQPDNEVVTFAYAGSFLPGARDPDSLMEYLAELDIPFRFLIFTNKPEFLGRFVNRMKDKLLVYEYIPRDELMKVLVRMDFLINFDNNTTRNSPSKLIDYSICGRPVLNIRRVFNKEDLVAFLNRDYNKKMPLPAPVGFHISNVSRSFLRLIG